MTPMRRRSNIAHCSPLFVSLFHMDVDDSQKERLCWSRAFVGREGHHWEAEPAGTLLFQTQVGVDVFQKFVERRPQFSRHLVSVSQDYAEMKL